MLWALADFPMHFWNTRSADDRWMTKVVCNRLQSFTLKRFSIMLFGCIAAYLGPYRSISLKKASISVMRCASVTATSLRLSYLVK